MMIQEKSIYFLYSQLAIFNANLNNPFNDWTENHVFQGFSWRPNSVSFKMLREEGDCKIIVCIKEKYEVIRPETVRAIRVPFHVEEGKVEIASISEGFKISIPSGQYSLFFETRIENDIILCHFTFDNEYHPEAEILVCDVELNPSYPLEMKAYPAL